MESARKTNKKGERKGQFVISSGISNGNGITGLLVFGGALAIAGFIALSSFATNRNKAKANSALSTEPEPKPQQLSSDDNIKSQDHDDHHVHVHETENTPNNDGDAVSASHVTSDNQTLILEKTVDSPNCFDDDHQEIVLSDDSLPESGVSSSNENGIEEECLASMFHNSESQAHEDDPQESLKSIQTETRDDDDDDNNAVLESGKEEEKEEEKEAEEEVEVVVEEDGSKVTERTALYSNGEEIRPEELTEEEGEQDFEGGKGTTESEIQSEEAQGVNKTDSSASAGTNVAVTPDATSNVKANFSVGLNHQPSPSHSFQLITWLMPLLLLLASLLLLVLFTQQSFYVPDQGN